MKGDYPGTCDRSHFDHDQGVCRMTAGGDFMLMGFDDGISVPIFNECIAEDLKKNEGETEEQFRARKKATALKRGEEACRSKIPTFDTRSEAVRHCETNGCTMIVHDKNSGPKFLDKPMISTECVNFNSEEQCNASSRCEWANGSCTSGVSTSMATSIDRTKLGVLPTPLCRFCDVPGIPSSFGRVQRDNCCRCGGGEFRRFFTAPLYRLINPLEPSREAVSKRAVEIINTGPTTKWEIF